VDRSVGDPDRIAPLSASDQTATTRAKLGDRLRIVTDVVTVGQRNRGRPGQMRAGVRLVLQE
jgi:hypothetical protein